MNQLVWNVFLHDPIVQALNEEYGIVYWIEENDKSNNVLFFSDDLFDLQNKEIIANGTKQELIQTAQSHFNTLNKKVKV